MGANPVNVARAVCVGVLGLLFNAGCSESRAPDATTSPPGESSAARVVPATAAISGAHVPTLDPVTLHAAEIRQALGTDPACVFRYTSSGRPVVAVTAPTNAAPMRGVIKLNGHLVILEASAEARTNAGTPPFAFAAEPLRIEVRAPTNGQAGAAGREGQQEANMVFEIGKELRVGYRGYLACGNPASGG